MTKIPADQFSVDTSGSFRLSRTAVTSNRRSSSPFNMLVFTFYASVTAISAPFLFVAGQTSPFQSHPSPSRAEVDQVTEENLKNFPFDMAEKNTQLELAKRGKAKETLSSRNQFSRKESSSARDLCTIGEFYQVGSPINGEDVQELFGYTVSLSSDGTVVAVGTPFHEDNDHDIGHVHVYEFKNRKWAQIGQQVNGFAIGDNTGKSLSLSGDGTTLALGHFYYDNLRGMTQVHRYDASSNTWNQIGQNLLGKFAYDLFGRSTSLSEDGNVLACGAPFNDDNGDKAGHARVYSYFDVGSASYWALIGELSGETSGDQFGNTISLSADGTVVAIGSQLNSDNGSYSGHVRVHKFDIASTTWSQLGQDIDGESEGDYSGSDISLSDDGTIVAIGAFNNGENGVAAGHARVFRYKSTSNIFEQLGEDIDGETALDMAGTSVSLSGDGSIVAVGALQSDGAVNYAGDVRVFSYDDSVDEWTKVGVDIDGEESFASFGYSVSLSADGNTVAVGSPKHGDTDTGRVQVFTMRDNCDSTPVPTPVPTPLPTMSPTSSPTAPDCTNNEDKVTITIKTDKKGSEIIWFLKQYKPFKSKFSNVEKSGKEKYGNKTKYIEDYCVKKDKCMKFLIKDKIGKDGLCCDHGKGWWSISVNDELKRKKSMVDKVSEGYKWGPCP